MSHLKQALPDLRLKTRDRRSTIRDRVNVRDDKASQQI